MQLFFLSEISVYLSQFLLLYITFLLMVLKQGTFQILPLTVFEIVKSQKEEKQRNIISGQFFSFSNFSGFWKYRNKLWHQLKQISLINYQNFWSYATFLLKFWHTLKQIWKMPLQQGFCLACIYISMDPKLLEPKKIVFHVTKKRY